MRRLERPQNHLQSEEGFVILFVIGLLGLITSFSIFLFQVVRQAHADLAREKVSSGRVFIEMHLRHSARYAPVIFNSVIQGASASLNRELQACLFDDFDPATDCFSDFSSSCPGAITVASTGEKWCPVTLYSDIAPFQVISGVSGGAVGYYSETGDYCTPTSAAPCEFAVTSFFKPTCPAAAASCKQAEKIAVRFMIWQMKGGLAPLEVIQDVVIADDSKLSIARPATTPTPIPPPTPTPSVVSSPPPLGTGPGPVAASSSGGSGGSGGSSGSSGSSGGSGSGPSPASATPPPPPPPAFRSCGSGMSPRGGSCHRFVI